MVHMEICGNNIMIWYNQVNTIYGPRPRSGKVVYTSKTILCLKEKW